VTSSVLAEIFIDKARVIQESEPPSRTDGDCAPRVIAAPSVTRKHAMLRRPRMLSILGHIAISAGILLLWQFVSGRWLDANIISSPDQIFEVAVAWSRSGYLLAQTVSTFSSVAAGFVVGAVLGFLVAVLLTEMPLLGRFSEPYLIALSVIPAIALVPIFVIWFGLGVQVKILMGLWSTFSIVFVTSYQGLRAADAKLLELSQVYGASRLQRLVTIRVWSALPFFLSGAKLALPKCALAVVATEFLAGSSGLGYAILRAGNNLDIGGLFVGVITLTLVTLLISNALVKAEDIFLQWVPKERRK
jgi:NitT/TauT family transport system permease protein